MTRQQYEKLTSPLRTPGRRRAIIGLNKLLTGSVYAAYILLCLYLLLTRDAYLIPLVLICGIPFVLLTVIRAKINAPRPYEVWDIEPLIPKDTKGRSFPSRHIFSTFLIAVAVCPVNVFLGAAVAVTGVLLAVIRVLGGVHFTKDVIAGGIIGILSGIAGLTVRALI